MNYLTGKRGKKGLIGIEVVMANLAKKSLQIQGLSRLGLIECAVLIQRETEDTPPTTPRDLGNLRQSWFTSRGGGSKKAFVGKNAGDIAADHATAIAMARTMAKQSEPNPSIVFGFSANYAAPVHEMVGVNFKRPGSGAKFFQTALSRNTKQMLSILRDSINLK